MYIVFNSAVSGLGNNGGSRTILLSAKELESLGHRCDVVTNTDNFTWFEHKHVINYIPNDADVVINVAAVDYEVTRRCNVPKKYAWWRGHENWSNTEGFLCRCYLDREVKNIVNSKGMQKLLEDYGTESAVVYQGIDIDKWSNENLRSEQNIRIGCLYSSRDIKRWKDFVKLSKTLGCHGYDYVAMGSGRCTDGFLTEYLQNPLHRDLNSLYSSCHIWMSPVISEGLHNPPMEASLCGVLVLCSDCATNGMVLDYAFDDTAMIYKYGHIEQAVELIRNPDWSLVGNMQEYIRKNIGTRVYNMKNMVAVLDTEGVVL